jgi:hypothetical protein
VLVFERLPKQRGLLPLRAPLCYGLGARGGLNVLRMQLGLQLCDLVKSLAALTFVPIFLLDEEATHFEVALLKVIHLLLLVRAHYRGIASLALLLRGKRGLLLMGLLESADAGLSLGPLLGKLVLIPSLGLSLSLGLGLNLSLSLCFCLGIGLSPRLRLRPGVSALGQGQIAAGTLHLLALSLRQVEGGLAVPHPRRRAGAGARRL